MLQHLAGRLSPLPQARRRYVVEQVVSGVFLDRCGITVDDFLTRAEVGNVRGTKKKLFDGIDARHGQDIVRGDADRMRTALRAARREIIEFVSKPEGA